MSLPKLDRLSRLTNDDIQKWLDLNAEVNSRMESKAWVGAAFAACRRLGISEEPSVAHTVVVSHEQGSRVGGVIVASDTKVLACFTILPQGGFRLDLEQTTALQRIRPGHVVALLLAGQVPKESPHVF